MYGFFECEDCGNEWESAKVYYKDESNDEYYEQQCKECDEWCSPYRVEEKMCSRCDQIAKYCDCDKDHNNDPSKAHRSDLCEKCMSGNPCR